MEHRNLRRVLRDKNISIKNYAHILGVTEKTVQNKLAGKSDFSYPEVKETCSLLPEYNEDYLFEKAGEKDE